MADNGKKVISVIYWHRRRDIMELLYRRDLKEPYRPHKENKIIPLSDALKKKFNQFYKEMQESEDLKKEKWTDHAERLKQDVQLEVQRYGNRKSIYVSDYVEFLYGACCLLIAKFDISQAETGRILGIKAEKFHKIGIYPKRSYEGYFKYGKAGDQYKSFIPNHKDTVGIRIARFINENVRAVYECYGFAGVSNDLDFFANICIDGKKAYYLTMPLEQDMGEKDEDFKRLSSICKSRFLFATANNFDNNVTLHKAGEIKRKIVRLLEMDDRELLRKSGRLRKMIQEGKGYEKYIINKKRFTDALECYDRRKRINQSIEVGEYIDPELDSDLDIWREAELDIDMFLDTGMNTEETKNWLERSVKEKEEELLSLLSYRRKGNQALDMEAFSDWIRILREFQKEELALELMKLSKGYGNSIGDSDKMIKAAAIFWILEVFPNEGISEAWYGEVIEYLKKNSLLSYFDSLNKEVSQGKQTHLFLEQNDFSIADKVFGQVGEKREHPFLVYVDMEAYKNLQQEINGITDINNVFLVARDKTGSVQEYGMQTLSPELNLYIRGNRNGRV